MTKHPWMTYRCLVPYSVSRISLNTPARDLEINYSENASLLVAGLETSSESALAHLSWPKALYQQSAFSLLPDNSLRCNESGPTLAWECPVFIYQEIRWLPLVAVRWWTLKITPSRSIGAQAQAQNCALCLNSFDVPLYPLPSPYNLHLKHPTFYGKDISTAINSGKTSFSLNNRISGMHCLLLFGYVRHGYSSVKWYCRSNSTQTNKNGRPIKGETFRMGTSNATLNSAPWIP